MPVLERENAYELQGDQEDQLQAQHAFIKTPKTVCSNEFYQPT